MAFPALIFLVFSAVYYFYPHVTGRGMNVPMGCIHFGITLIGAYILFWPTQYVDGGMAGMPRRYIDYSNGTVMDRFTGVNVFKIRGSGPADLCTATFYC
jgi:cytochrome c oxidase subunit 1